MRTRNTQRSKPYSIPLAPSQRGLLTSLEKKVLLSFAKSNKQCDIDGVGHPEYEGPYFRGKTAKEVSKVWNSIIKKLQEK